MKHFVRYFQVILLFTVVVFSSTLMAKDFNLINEKSFTTQRDGFLLVEAPGADIIISGWDKNEADIHVFGNDNAAKKCSFEYTKTSDGVKVIIKRKSSFFGGLFNWNSLSLRVEVKIPNKYNFDLHTSGGDIKIQDISGALRMHTSGGNLTVDRSSGILDGTTSGGNINVSDFQGSVNMETSGGEILLKSANGNVDVSSSGGDIKLDVANGKVAASTSGGNVELTYSGMNSGIKLNTSGGDIHVKVPKEIKSHAYLSTSGGEVSCDLPTSRSYKVTASKFDADINGGGPELHASTSGGNIRVSSK